MQSLHFGLLKTWKNNWNIVLKVNMKKLNLKMAEIINNKCDPSHVSNFKRIHSLYCWSAPDTHQESTKACFEQSPGKKEQSNGFPGSERLKIPLIWSLYWKSATISSYYIINRPHCALEEEKIIVIVTLKAPFWGTFILKISDNEFWIYHRPPLKSCYG